MWESRGSRSCGASLATCEHARSACREGGGGAGAVKTGLCSAAVRRRRPPPHSPAPPRPPSPPTPPTTMTEDTSKLAAYPFLPYYPGQKLRICVTGAGGFIASALGKRLKKEGHTVVACDWKRNEHMAVRGWAEGRGRWRWGQRPGPRVPPRARAPPFRPRTSGRMSPKPWRGVGAAADAPPCRVLRRKNSATSSTSSTCASTTTASASWRGATKCSTWRRTWGGWGE